MYEVLYQINDDIGTAKELGKRYNFAPSYLSMLLRQGKTTIKGYPFKKLGKKEGELYDVINDKGKVEFTGTAIQIANEYLFSLANVYAACRTGYQISEEWYIRKSNKKRGVENANL